MKSLKELYRIAQQQNITVDLFPLEKREALSLMELSGDCYIAIDPHKLRGEADERNKLAHELGHCCTGAFYNQYSRYNCRKRQENRADRWAIRQLIPADDLDNAIAAGCTEIWELAEHFGVSEDFIRKAVCYHVHGNLATELYF
ncbi:MAG: ImmA/IrrE family metallo-endopeptidase [Oscillospiraceae bacterium]|nr:ImmA/IrrE family metallo-endopeptidase [Oscillospiraceae bacterium]